MNSNQGLHILVVDDLATNRELLSRHLERTGYSVDVAEDGATALQKLNKGAYNLVLLDIMMPKVDGFMVLETLRQQFQASELPVIMISAMGDSENIVKALTLGANDFITKPFERKILLSRVRTQLDTGSLYRQIKLSEERYALAFSASNDGLWDWDILTGEVFYSDRCREMMGLAKEKSVDSIEQWFERVHPDDVNSLRLAIYGHLEDPAAIVKHKYRVLHADGSYRWMLCHAKALFSDDSKAIRMTASQSDISATYTFDPLTGLPNNQVFMDRLNRVSAHAKRRGKVCFSLISMSLDNREKITSAIGPAGYDKLNTEIARRLSNSIRKDDYFIQTSGDVMISFMPDNRYMLLIENLNDNAVDVLKISERMQKVITHPFTVFGETIHCSLSIGICIPATPGQNVDELIRNCITAEAIAHREGCKVTIYDKDMHGRAIDYLRLENELRTAISNDELRAHYQPIVRLIDSQEVGSESLVRWEHPKKGLLSPFHFITLAEESGMIDSIDEWVLRESCRQYKRGTATSKFISVNISVQELNSGWVKRIRSVIQEYSIPPEHIHLEITESIFMGDITAAIKLLNELVDVGISFAVDDFGTGYSCFAYLRHLPASYLKIDKAFIDDMLHDLKAEHLVQSIIRMGHGLGMKVIAEGVEEEQQAEKLTIMGCDYAQGYYFGKPVPAAS
ncbi:putative bifunctional diguanylate cyclase/phosphodiesterase [Amphritea sp. HPY]|uniref:putative bifunctional diguanylate cyclase/phosphodiesterase n=1 Tax=Amphritea sp. HPY TaxID=3421652 RepID=UPI003D7D9B4A